MEFWANSLLKPPSDFWSNQTRTSHGHHKLRLCKILRRSMLKMFYSEYKMLQFTCWKKFANVRFDKYHVWQGNVAENNVLVMQPCCMSGTVRWTTTKQLSVFCNESSGILAPKPRIISQRAHLLHCWCQKITPSWPNGNLLCQRATYLLTIIYWLITSLEPQSKT